MINKVLAAQQPPVAPSAPTAQHGGGYVLQIGSFTSQAEANASWQTYKAAHSSVAGYAADVAQANLGSKGTWYRLRIGPFATLAEASAACAKLKAQGGKCFPAKR
jgi:cell division septation protein DedD